MAELLQIAGLARSTFYYQCQAAQRADAQCTLAVRIRTVYGAHTAPRSTQAEWIGAIGVELAPLVQAVRDEMLSRSVLHVDETPVAMLRERPAIPPSNLMRQS